MTNIPEGFGPAADKSEPMMSAEIGELAKALSAAQGAITGAKKDADNPFFKSKYADLAACWEACRGPLSDHGLAVVQTPEHNLDGVTLVTLLMHSSGQWIKGRLTMIPGKNDPQGVGSCLTYARRYALAAIVGLAQVDDDAESATFRMSKPAETKVIKAMEKAIAAEDHAAVWEVWSELDEAEKNYMNSTLDRTRKTLWKKWIMEAGQMSATATDPNYEPPADV